MKKSYSNVLIDALLREQIVVMPTDTIYGLCALASSEQACERVAKLKGNRRSDKSFITLIDTFDRLQDFGIKSVSRLNEYWPGPVSVVLEAPKAPNHLQAPDGTICLRLPDNDQLRQLIGQTGPLIATSANRSSHPPANSVNSALGYFGDAVAHYEDHGLLDASPSKVIHLRQDGSTLLLRA